MTTTNIVALSLINTLFAAMPYSLRFYSVRQRCFIAFIWAEWWCVWVLGAVWGKQEADRVLWRDWGTDRTLSMWHIQSLRSKRYDLTADESHDISGVVLIKRNCFRVQSGY